MDDGNFDIVVIGTGITESIAAAALSKAGFKVAHIDESPYYGGNQASLALDELVQWADAAASSSNPKYTSVSRSLEIPPKARRYSISLSPSVIPSTGPMISSLISSGVAKYGGFRLLERVAVYNPSGTIKSVPGTKEDVFKSKEISLVNKRRLMRFLMFAVDEFEDKKELAGAHEMPFADFLKTTFSLSEDIQSALVFALAFCSSLSEPTLPALRRVQRYLRSAGRYGPSPFLIGHYGGVGEIAQGFCRAAAVSGGVYILGRKILSIVDSSTTQPDITAFSKQKSSSPNYSITLDDFPDTLTSQIVISSATHLPVQLESSAKKLLANTSDDPYGSSCIVRCIAIVDQGIVLPTSTSSSGESVIEEEATTQSPSEAESPQTQPLDAGIIVFPPSSVKGGSDTAAVTVLIAGESTMSTPNGTWVWYISLPMPHTNVGVTSAEQSLQPYLNATLALSRRSGSSPPISSNAPSPEVDATPKPLFTLFYIEHPTPPLQLVQETTNPKTWIITPPLHPALPLTEVPDAAAAHAEALYWEAVKVLREGGTLSTAESGTDDPLNVTEGAKFGVTTFWPPLETEDESGEEEAW